MTDQRCPVCRGDMHDEDKHDDREFDYVCPDCCTHEDCTS